MSRIRVFCQCEPIQDGWHLQEKQRISLDLECGICFLQLYGFYFIFHLIFLMPPLSYLQLTFLVFIAIFFSKVIQKA